MYPSIVAEVAPAEGRWVFEVTVLEMDPLAVSPSARPEQSPRARSLRRALLMPQVNPGSPYRRGKKT